MSRRKQQQQKEEWDETEDTQSVDISEDQEGSVLTLEDLEDLFRVEVRRWLIENAERLFLEKCRTSFPANGTKPAFKKQKTQYEMKPDAK